MPISSEPFLVFDLGGTNIRAAAVAYDGSIVARAKTLTPNSSSQDIVTAFAKLADECSEIANTHFQAAGAAVPAAIDKTSGILEKLPNVKSLEGIHLQEHLERRLGIPFEIENDATAATVGEHRFGAAAGCSDVIGITLGTGIGGGIIINGSVHRGKNGTAGEIGHVCIEPDGYPCGCGSHGCIEQYASGTSIARDAAKAGLTDTSPLGVYDAAKKGDERAVKIFDSMGRYLGIFIAGLLNTINPERVVIAGGVASAWDMFEPRMRSELVIRAYPQPLETVSIVKAKLGDDAGLLGMASLVMNAKMALQNERSA